jgi:hypothetical protein
MTASDERRAVSDEQERRAMNDALRVTLTGSLAPLALLALLAPSCGGGQPAASRSTPPAAVSAAPSTAASSAATLDGTVYTLSGDVTCEHADDGSIYDVPAAMWHATLKADGATVSYVNVTIWQFKQGGPAQFSLGLQAGGVFHHASTIKGATLIGSGTATVEREATTSLHVKGADEKGVAFDVTLRCAKVTQAVEEGGR